MKNTVMEINDFKCVLNMPKALKNKDGVNGLPPYNPRKCSLVDEYAACPDSWMHGSVKAASYFVPVKTGDGMWLDFNANHSNSHYVAILVSVQGINPLTGQQTKAIRLEQYQNKCPKHDIEFGHDLFCEKCKYKWNPQNYISSNVTPYGFLWIDGFRNQSGEVRQWVFTEEQSKGVAAQLIGDERVYAIGIAFYLSKEPKPKVEYPNSFYHQTLEHQWTSKKSSIDVKWVGGMSLPKSFTLCSNAPSGGIIANYAPRQHTNCNVKRERTTTEQVDAQTLEIGAGAKITQQFYKDTENLDFWQEEPAGFLYVNYCTVEDYEKIIAAGKKDLTNGGESFLAGLEFSV